MQSKRTTSVIKNLIVGVAGKVILLGATFLVRTLFIRILGVEYTGISSLYTNILSFLSLAELGMGSVLTFELYRPLQEKDEETVSAYVLLFQKIYLIVICAILGIGLCLLPFLKVITNSSLDQEHLIGYYLLYLADSACSYFVVYRTTVIEADQKRYVTQTVDIATKLVMYICQSIYLVIYKNFAGYLCIQVVFTVVKNLILHGVATRMYPYLREKTARKISPSKLRKVFHNVRATFIAKLSNVILTQTDSIIISVLLGVAAVGYYTNYNMIVVYINSINSIMYSGLEASIGSLNAEENIAKSYLMYKRLAILFAIFTTLCTTGYLCTIQNFIVLWIGNGYLQSIGLVVAIAFTIYMNLAMNVISMYRQTMGVFREVQKIYPLMAVLNIILSVIFVKWIGIAGVPLGTAISRLLTTFWFEGLLVFKKMEQPFSNYVKEQVGFAVFTLVTCVVAFVISNSIHGAGIVALFTKAIIAVILVMLVAWILYGRSAEWKWMMQLLRTKINHKVQ